LSLVACRVCVDGLSFGSASPLARVSGLAALGHRHAGPSQSPHAVMYQHHHSQCTSIRTITLSRHI